MVSKAGASFLRLQPRKLRLVADLVRGKNAKQAETLLRFMPKRGAKSLAKIVHAAIANAENRGDVDTDNLFIKKIIVNNGPMYKRSTPRARGMASPIQKKTSHVELVLEER